MYVHDLVSGSIIEEIEVIKQSIELFRKGGFNLQ